jgi:FkbH-like protein
MEGEMYSIHEMGVVGSFTTEPLGRFVQAGGAVVPAIPIRCRFAPFGQLIPVCRHPNTYFGDALPRSILLLWRVEDLYEPLLAKFAAGDETAEAAILKEVAAFCGEVAGLRTRFDGTVIFATPPIPQSPGTNRAGFADASRWLRLHYRVIEAIGAQFLQRRDIRLLDLEAIVRQCGAERSYDDRKWYLYRQPFSEVAFRAIARQVERIVASETRAAKKCVVLDCDNTLWGGIIGEDGPSGIKLGDSFPGRAYVDFQKELMALQQRGIFLAVCSKNNMADALEVFEKHDAMLLRREHFSAFEVNWERKSRNIERIAKQLNIGLDSVVFIDDSPTEIEEVRHNLPSVTSILVPKELAILPRLIRESVLFDAAAETAEDRLRVASVQHERQREQLKEEMSEDAYLASLGLVVDVFEAEDVHVDRVTQLINKTNQFNLTTRRRTVAEVWALHSDPSWLLLCLKVADRFGEYGLTGVAIVKYGTEAAVVDTLLLSCRVLGRGVEAALISVLADHAADRGCSRLIGEHIPTAKNAPCKDFYAEQGFSPIAANGSISWQLTLGHRRAPPAHLKLIRPKMEAPASPCGQLETTQVPKDW